MMESERNDLVRKVSERIVKNFATMSEIEKQTCIKNLVDMLDGVHLLAIGVAVEMTPEQGSKEQTNTLPDGTNLDDSYWW